MEPEILSASHDIIFKKIFADENNADLLQSLLSAVLEIPQDKITDLRVINSESVPENKVDKLIRMDIVLEFKAPAKEYGENRNNEEAHIANIEMQITNEQAYNNRALYYWSKLFDMQLRKSGMYSSLKECISINFLSFNMFPDYPEKYHFTFRMREDTLGFPLGDRDEIHFLELKKLNNEIGGGGLKEMWLQLLKADTKEELDMLNDNTNVPEIKKAVKVVYKMSADERMREEYRVREKARLDYWSEVLTYEAQGIEKGMAQGLEKGRAQGLEEGMAQGREQSKASLIEGMKKNGLSEDVIKAVLKSASLD